MSAELIQYISPYIIEVIKSVEKDVSEEEEKTIIRYVYAKLATMNITNLEDMVKIIKLGYLKTKVEE